MNVRLWPVTVLLIFLAFGHAALAQSQEHFECREIRENSPHHTRLRTLFWYSQIAERPKHEDNSYMDHCPPSSGSPEATAPTHITSLTVPADLMTAIEARFEENGLAATLEIDGANAISVICSASNGRTTLPIRTRIKLTYNLARDWVGLGFSFGAEINGGPEGNLPTSAIWAPYYDEDSNEIVYSARGTHPLDMEQVLSNYLGDDCPFPAATVVVSEICRTFAEEVRTEFESNTFQIVDSDIERIKSANNRLVTLTGHSLGGHAVQYMAAHPPNECFDPHVLTIDIVPAYAFASTRNTAPDPDQVPTSATGGGRIELRSYVISGDEVLHRLSLGQGQIGLVTRYYPSEGFRYGRKHSIDSIQMSICDCINGHGEFSIEEAIED